MQDLLSALKDTPLPTILTVAGIGFLLLSIASQLSGKITVEPSQRKLAFITGIVLICLGIGLNLGGTIFPALGTTSSEGKVTFEQDTNRYGGDYEAINLTAPDPKLCQDTCQKDARCQAYTYVPVGIQGPTAKCWLKDVQPSTTVYRGLVSGIRTH
jgi:hypothetical protein